MRCPDGGETGNGHSIQATSTEDFAYLRVETGCGARRMHPRCQGFQGCRMAKQ